MVTTGDKKTGSEMSPFFNVKRSTLFEFCHSFADDTFLQDLAIIGHTHQEGGGTQTIDLAWETFGVIKNAGQGVIGKKRTGLVTGQLDLVADISNGLAQIEGQEVIGGGQALEKGFVGHQA